MPMPPSTTTGVLVQCHAHTRYQTISLLTNHAASTGKPIAAIHANWRRMRSSGLRFSLIIGQSLCRSVQREGGEVLRAVDLRQVLLRRATDDEVLEHEHVHLGAEEAAQRVLRRADDRLAAHVEARVDHHRAAGALLEAAHQARE